MSTSRATMWLRSLDMWLLASEPSATRKDMRSAKMGSWAGAGGERASSTIKVVESEALAGVVLGSEYWSRVACVGDSVAGEFSDIETNLYN